jgi:hypothetical protein
MPSGGKALLIYACLVMALARPSRALAVIFYSTANPSYNTTAPAGSLAGSGWQWIGFWGGYEGTPIGANYFLTAQHVGGTVGDPFTFQGVQYMSIAFYDDPQSDLRIIEVNGSLPAWAPIYRGSGEVGSSLVVMGEGLSRGAAVQVGEVTKGWMWGSGGGVVRWGQNTVNSILAGVPYWGSLLYCLFQSGQGANECDLASGDSSSPAFIKTASGWQLAGVGAAVDGPFNTTNTGSGFDAAIFDGSGLYIWDSTASVWEQIPPDEPVPFGYYLTQVSVRAVWIDSIVPAGGVTSETPLMSGPATIALAVSLGALGAWQAGRSPAPAG